METKPPDLATVVAATTGTTQGAAYRALYVERQVKIYPIQEHELTTLNMFSSTVTFCASIASGTAVFSLNVLWDMAIAQNQAVSAIGKPALGICGLVVAACLVIGIWAYRARKSELSKILNESRLVG
jgi:hypothetical protein